MSKVYLVMVGIWLNYGDDCYPEEPKKHVDSIFNDKQAALEKAKHLSKLYYDGFKEGYARIEYENEVFKTILYDESEEYKFWVEEWEVK